MPSLPEAWDGWRTCPFSLQALQDRYITELKRKRVLEAFSKIQEDSCIITHGGVIAAIMEHLFPDENKNRYEWQPKNGCGYKIEMSRYWQIPNLPL